MARKILYKSWTFNFLSTILINFKLFFIYISSQYFLGKTSVIINPLVNPFCINNDFID